MNPNLPISKSSSNSFSFSLPAKFKHKKFSSISMSVMADRNEHREDQQPLSLEALVNSAHKQELFGAIKNQLPICLSETNLHLTVPGLKSKTRGKVDTNQYKRLKLYG